MRRADKESKYDVGQLQMKELPSGSVHGTSVHYADDDDEKDVIELVKQKTPGKYQSGDNHPQDTEGTQQIRKWLTEINLLEYYDNFVGSGFKSMEFIKAIQSEDRLKEIGVNGADAFGHRVLLMAKINALRQGQNEEETEAETEVETEGYTTGTVVEGNNENDGEEIEVLGDDEQQTTNGIV